MLIKSWSLGVAHEEREMGEASPERGWRVALEEREVGAANTDQELRDAC